MKKIEAIICPAEVGNVYAALEKIGCPGIMFSEIGDLGRQNGIKQQFRKKSYYHTPLLTKAKLEIVTKDADVEKIVEAIRASATTGQIGDGKIFVLDLAESVRVQTEEGDGVAIR